MRNPRVDACVRILAKLVTGKKSSHQSSQCYVRLVVLLSFFLLSTEVGCKRLEHVRTGDGHILVFGENRGRCVHHEDCPRCLQLRGSAEPLNRDRIWASHQWRGDMSLEAIQVADASDSSGPSTGAPLNQ